MLDKSQKTMFLLSGYDKIIKVTAHRDGNSEDEWWWLIDDYQKGAGDHVFRGQTFLPDNLFPTPDEAVQNFLVKTRKNINSYMKTIEMYTKQLSKAAKALVAYKKGEQDAS
jgi:hypothetical protein